MGCLQAQGLSFKGLEGTFYKTKQNRKPDHKWIKHIGKREAALTWVHVICILQDTGYHKNKETIFKTQSLVNVFISQENKASVIKEVGHFF